MLDLLGSAGSEIAGFLGDTVVDGLQSVLYATLYKVLYYIGWAVCQVLSLFNSMFEVVAGLNTVAYNGKSTYLINVFFSNSTVTKIYWGMALLGIVIAVGFAISAVIRKTFDSNDREKRSHGAILTSLFKAILLILSMNFIITAVVNATNVLMQQINYIFVNGEDLGKDESIEFTDEHFAAMARALNTIGNYSLNPSHNNRYNLNSCFNELRYDLLYLQQEGVFEFYYVTKDEEGNSIATWQSALQRIANSANLTQDLKMDVYYDSVSKAILDAMELLKVNSSLMPLESYERQYLTSRKSTPLDRVLFLMSTMRAAKNSEYNVNPSMTDPVRGPYYSGEKSIYNLDEVNEDFDIGITSTDYLLWYFMGYKLLFFLARIILNCIARIFNIMLLYLIAPPIIATMPQDDGAKFKQWMVAFVVQTFSVFGTVIAMRLLLVFVPIVLDGALVLFENALLNFLAKVVIVLAGFEVAEKATATITGILADNAGFQSIQAGDMGSVADKAMDVGEKYAKSALGGAVGLGGKTLKYGLMAGGIATGGALLGAAWGAYGVGKGIGALGGKIHNAWKNREGAGGDGGAPGGAPGGASGGSPGGFGGGTDGSNMLGGGSGGENGNLPDKMGSLADSLGGGPENSDAPGAAGGFGGGAFGGGAQNNDMPAANDYGSGPELPGRASVSMDAPASAGFGGAGGGETQGVGGPGETGTAGLDGQAGATGSAGTEGRAGAMGAQPPGRVSLPADGGNNNNAGGGGGNNNNVGGGGGNNNNVGGGNNNAGGGGNNNVGGGGGIEAVRNAKGNLTGFKGTKGGNVDPLAGLPVISKTPPSSVQKGLPNKERNGE